MKTYLLTFFIWMSCFFFPLSAQTDSIQSNQDQKEETHPVPSSESPSPHPSDSFDYLKDGVDRESGNFQVKFFNMLVVLGLLIGFMILASWMLKRMMRTRVDQLNATSSIKVLETRHLSPKSILYLLDIEGHRLVIAESHAGLSHLATLPAIEEDHRSSER